VVLGLATIVFHTGQLLVSTPRVTDPASLATSQTSCTRTVVVARFATEKGPASPLQVTAPSSETAVTFRSYPSPEATPPTTKPMPSEPETSTVPEYVPLPLVSV